MRKIHLFIFTILLGGMLFASVASTVSAAIGSDAATQLQAAAGAKGADFGAPKDPRQLVADIIRVVLGMLGIVFLSLTIYAGFLWMTAGGNEEQVGKAKTLLTQAVIGLTIVLASYSITLFAIKFAKGEYTDYWDGRVRRFNLDKAPVCGVGTGYVCP